MIIFVHNNVAALKLLDKNKADLSYVFNKNAITASFLEVAQNFPNILIIWCHEAYLPFLNIFELRSVFHHRRVMASFSCGQNSFLPSQYGYLDRTPFVKVNTKVTYPTWIMSSKVGGIYSDVLNHLANEVHTCDNFEYFLNSFSKLSMDYGLFCYSEPRLLRDTNLIVKSRAMTTFELFKFVKQHHKWVWVCFLALACFVFEQKNYLLPLLNALKFKRRSPYKSVQKMDVKSTRKIVESQTVDVIIPTMGRADYLYNVLLDLSAQTIVPQNVIIVEQNAKPDSVSQLNYLKSEAWPFVIKHSFIHQTGVCNARNLALSQVTSEWTLLGDDDNRFEKDLIEKFFEEVEKYGVKAGMTVYLQPEENQTYMETAQTGIFGGGNALIKSELIQKVKFDTRYEFNYGEDSDFGNQIRNSGEDVVFFANIKITHLKAPVGGYRTPLVQPWDNEKIKPKPSPTILLHYQKYYSTHQVLGYKLFLKIKSYKNSLIKNPLTYHKQFNKQWEQSVLWSKKLWNEK